MSVAMLPLVEEPLLQVDGLEVRFAVRQSGQDSSTLVAVDRVSFDVAAGEVLGLVGESGCGKSTTGLALLRLVPASAGTVLFRGQDLMRLTGLSLRKTRRDLQIVFQNPQTSLNPRLTVARLLSEPLRIHGVLSRGERASMVARTLDLVGLPASAIDRYPHEFSGGQQQRIAIARAVILEPAFVVLDEAVSALDVSIRAQILNLLAELRSRLGLTYLFISHDLSVVRHVADRVAVMYLGRVIELAERDSIFARPLHPYTQALMSAVPIPDPAVEQRRERIVLKGDVPSPLNPPSGCRFHTRCPFSRDRCQEADPELEVAAGGHLVACHFWSEIEAARGPRAALPQTTDIDAKGALDG
jgi:oligopeptide/dipeptide ABC transporter ATP-binding protein